MNEGMILYFYKNERKLATLVEGDQRIPFRQLLHQDVE